MPWRSFLRSISNLTSVHRDEAKDWVKVTGHHLWHFAQNFTGHPLWHFAQNRYCALNISPIFIKCSPVHAKYGKVVKLTNNKIM
jgi:hypothetical protein